MKIIIRVDASIHIGSGHVMRCLVLAEEFRQRGHYVKFVCRALEGNLIAYIKNYNFNVSVLDKETCTELEHQNNSNYLSWLSTTIQDDAKEFLSKIKEADIVIIDHYGIDCNWELIIRQNLACNIAVIDDLNRPHIADIIIDQNLWPDMAHRYSDCSCKKLLGPDYALLRPTFSQLKSKEINKKERILAFFGGTDPTEECLKLIKAIHHFHDLPFEILIVTGLINPNKDKLKKLQNSLFDVQTHLNNFEYELKVSKYILGASGISNWERFCLELPATIVSVAKNQERLSEYLYKINAVRYLGDGNLTSKDSYIKELNYLVSNWEMIKYKNIINVDGLGATKVAKEIEGLNHEM